jgi:hypothetical protein
MWENIMPTRQNQNKPGRGTRRRTGTKTTGRVILTATAGATLVGNAWLCAGAAGNAPLPLKIGPHLFIDSLLVAETTGTTRRVCSPERVAENPLVPSIAAAGNRPGVGCSGNQVGADYDPAAKMFRLWTVVDMRHDPEVVKAVGHITARWTAVVRESKDGLRWSEPKLMPGVGGEYFLCDPDCAEPGERFKSTKVAIGKIKRGMHTYYSADGFTWRMDEKKWEPYPGDENDIWAPVYDPLLKRYYIIMKPEISRKWTDVHGKEYSFRGRQVWISRSADFKNWSEPQPVFVPDAQDEGITQWYAASPGLRRGEHFIVFLRELRDDLKATRAPGDTAKPEQYDGGMGYTVLAWTSDGERWQRDRYTDKFLAPDPDPAAWDHAHAWVGAAVPVGDELWLYYGGYKYGHKYFRDRSIGLAKMKRDRFVARTAGPEGGRLTTPLVTLAGRRLTVNAKVRGELQVRLLDAAGRALPGFDFADGGTIRGDGVELPVAWKRGLEAVADQPVRLEFLIKDADLYAFDLAE